MTNTIDGKTVEIGIRPETLELTVNGEPVVTRKRFDLTFLQKMGAATTVASAAMGGFYAPLKVIDWFSK